MYDKEAEDKARLWIETITEETIEGTDFFSVLKDGSLLCRLASKHIDLLYWQIIVSIYIIVLYCQTATPFIKFWIIIGY